MDGGRNWKAKAELESDFVKIGGAFPRVSCRFVFISTVEGNILKTIFVFNGYEFEVEVDFDILFIEGWISFFLKSRPMLLPSFRLLLRIYYPRNHSSFFFLR